MRRSSAAIVLLCLAIAALSGVFVDAGRLSTERMVSQASRGALVSRLGLTDLTLFTEARYTRHPSQADLHSAFQDHPMALEHFPTGSLIPPPHTWFGTHADLAGNPASPD